MGGGRGAALGSVVAGRGYGLVESSVRIVVFGRRLWRMVFWVSFVGVVVLGV
jgi:hypothetical protein